MADYAPPSADVGHLRIPAVPADHVAAGLTSASAWAVSTRRGHDDHPDGLGAAAELPVDSQAGHGLVLLPGQPALKVALDRTPRLQEDLHHLALPFPSVAELDNRPHHAAQCLVSEGALTTAMTVARETTGVALRSGFQPMRERRAERVADSAERELLPPVIVGMPEAFLHGDGQAAGVQDDGEQQDAGVALVRSR